MCRHGGGKGGPPGEPDDCPPGNFCAHLLSLPGVKAPPDFCTPDAPGTCWALPVVCPDRAGLDRWIACGTPQNACASTCDAIRSGLPYKRASACP
jgi:hypothetical protein